MSVSDSAVIGGVWPFFAFPPSRVSLSRTVRLLSSVCEHRKELSFYTFIVHEPVVFSVC
jgi:hypothetical protein